MSQEMIEKLKIGDKVLIIKDCQIIEDERKDGEVVEVVCLDEIGKYGFDEDVKVKILSTGESYVICGEDELVFYSPALGIMYGF